MARMLEEAMIKQLINLGFIDLIDGKISEEDKVLLLHIYKSKLNGEQPNIKEAYSKFKAGELTSKSLINPTIGYQFGGNFDEIVEFMHESTCIKERIVSENIREARAFDAYEEKIQSVQKILLEKLDKIHMLQSMVNNNGTLTALCERLNMPATDENIQGVMSSLQSELIKAKEDYTSNKLNVLCGAINYIVKNDIRQKTYENGISVG